MLCPKIGMLSEKALRTKSLHPDFSGLCVSHSERDHSHRTNLPQFDRRNGHRPTGAMVPDAQVTLTNIGISDQRGVASSIVTKRSREYPVQDMPLKGRCP